MILDTAKLNTYNWLCVFYMCLCQTSNGSRMKTFRTAPPNPMYHRPLTSFWPPTTNYGLFTYMETGMGSEPSPRKNPPDISVATVIPCRNSHCTQKGTDPCHYYAAITLERKRRHSRMGCNPISKQNGFHSNINTQLANLCIHSKWRRFRSSIIPP